MSSSNSSGGGIGFILFIVFLVLKLTGVIAWSWWWVTCPLWLGLALALFGGVVIAGIMGIVGLIAALCSGK